MHVSQTSDHYNIIFSENGLRFYLRASIFQIFLGGMPPDPPSFSMLRTLIVLRMNSPLETAQKGPTPILYGPSPLQPWTLCPGNDF